MTLSGVAPPERGEPASVQRGREEGGGEELEPPAAHRETGERRPRPIAAGPSPALFFPVVVLLAVVVLGLLGLSGSSLGIYATHLGASEEEAGVLAGPPRPIRSDEWTVRTPWVLRQAELGLPTRVTSAVGTHDVAVLADLPTGGWEALLRPHTLSYRLLGPARAFAVEWWAYYAVQLLGIYALLVAVTSRPLLSALSAALVTLSPATQWWAAPGTFTTLGYGSLTAALVLWSIRAPSLRRRLVLAVAAGWGASTFLVALYVPWQVGTALVVVPVALGALTPSLVDPEARRPTLRAVAVVGLVVAGVAGTLFGAFLLSHREAVAAIADTVYPGRQPAHRGGTANLATLWGSALDYFAAQEQSAVVNGTNQSENSSALLLLVPVGLACFAHASAGRLRSHTAAFPLVGALVGGAVALAWMVLPLPAWVGRLALLTRAPPGRMFLPLGLASVLSLALLAHYHLSSGKRLRAWQLVTVAGAFAGAQLWAAGVYTVDGTPVSLWTASAFVAVVTVGVVLAMGRRPAAGLAVLAGFCLWQASLINPVQRGTGPLTDSTLRQQIDDLAEGRRRSSAWIVYGADALVVGTVTAAGMKTLSDISPYPDSDAWTVLDPDRRFEKIWNRYTRIGFLPGEPGQPIEMALVQPDSITVRVDPCSPALTALKVEVVVTQNLEVSSCTRPLARLAHGEGYVMVYERKP